MDQSQPRGEIIQRYIYFKINQLATPGSSYTEVDRCHSELRQLPLRLYHEMKEEIRTKDPGFRFDTSNVRMSLEIYR
jgi:hypothetical protein